MYIVYCVCVYLRRVLNLSQHVCTTDHMVICAVPLYSDSVILDSVVVVYYAVVLYCSIQSPQPSAVSRLGCQRRLLMLLLSTADRPVGKTANLCMLTCAIDCLSSIERCNNSNDVMYFCSTMDLYNIAGAWLDVM